ncbi:M23 family metallopeptidase [Pseudomarimonas arenosa]|uniref:M23 family metallopeptidase n=1 Tax=Pseudomarimonas arenosa TaxID=2774145 RepID=A0AAW3ZKN5_9GAMM|nr:M23 family metallopeptidase [Pseudomarimonas arenosa]MBD8525747.1 M23 family metallopeptidase [Pseudomarimonas arenosa]
MKTLKLGLAVLATSALAGLQAQPRLAEPVLIGGGPAPTVAHAPISPMQEWTLLREAQANMARLGIKPKGAVAPFEWPIALEPGIEGTQRTAMVNFVDLNPAFPNQLRDYQCGRRTYDTAAGYNHRGTDIGLWPFSWQTMAQESVTVRAVAPGSIVLKRDGNFDRNCSFDVPDTPNLLFIAHDDGSIGWYLHMKSGSLTDKEPGDRVETGEVLGRVGSSGISTGPHLHFELRDSLAGNAAVIDPFSGQCNTQPSRWAEQPDYQIQRLESVSLHSAPPELFQDQCNRPENPHHQRHFQPGQRLYLALYYNGQRANETAEIRLLGPDGAELFNFPFAATAQQMGGDYLPGSYWYFPLDLPTVLAPGRYRVEVDFAGHTRSQDFAVGGAIYQASGAWFEPSQSGHGFITEVINQADGVKLAVTWFAYLNGEPIWLFGVGPIVDGQARVPVLISRGGDFPPNYDPAAVAFEPWGELNFEFSSSESGAVNWTTSYPGYGSGSLNLTRLARLGDINLDDFDRGMRACASGSWYSSTQNGHGIQAQVLDIDGSRQLLIAWYVYVNGKQTWLTGLGPISGKRAVVELRLTSGGQFPPDFDPAAVQSLPWGQAEFDFIDNQNMEMRWQSELEGFGSGSLQLQRLTTHLQAQCL